MRSTHTLLVCVLLLLSLVSVSVLGGRNSKKNEKVLLRDVSAITLSRTGWTTGRRSQPIPQMKCVGGPCKYAPSTVLCSNAGFDGADVLWKCKADLEKGIKLGDISVVCEGYDYPEDPYILRGSCGLEYTLTGRAEVEKLQHHHETGHHNSYRERTYHSGSDDESSSAGTLFMLLIVAGIAYVIYKSCTSGGNGIGGGSDGSHPSGGFGGSGPHNPPPPPYGGGGDSYGSDCGTTYRSSSSSSSSGPGFWTGVAGGSALGYMMGSRNRGGNSGYNASNTGSGWGSSSRSSWGSSSSSSDDGPSSLGTSSSSAFGGTRRR